MFDFIFDLQRFNTVTEVSSLEELKTALTSGDEIKLTNNIELTEILTIASGQTVTLDLNGYTVAPVVVLI